MLCWITIVGGVLIMTGQHDRSEGLFYYFRLEDQVPGPILDSLDRGSLLLVLALVLTFVRPRIAAALSIVASLLCLPLYLYFTAPGPFRRVFGGEYSVPLEANFVWDRSAIFGVLAVAAALCTGIWNLRTVESQRLKRARLARIHQSSC
jgi:hypothetical protein